ncbi:MAG: 1-deoxy-D-xylulose-5-phosphate reductoisomerase [Gemmatimonadota bacterium]|jgi:1-deoxy-D-xylulose-5-phosphate reductoisomerase
MIRVAVLGATGSIGRSTLEVIRRHPGRFQVVALTSNRRVEALADLVVRFRPRLAVVGDERTALPSTPGNTEWRRGRDAVLDAASLPDVDVVVNALVGAAGLEPTLRALEAGHRLALANKESLVAGGPLVLQAAGRGGAEIVPIDSEHSAILQCLEGYDRSSVRRITLTASGGPFRGRNLTELQHVRPSEALNHPTWDMGAKITIDSATLANKALEVIEAHYLYGFGYDHIRAVVHPQSIVHSFVEFIDGSVLAQMGFPTMELPILYALSYPERVEDPTLQTYDPVMASPLSFEDIDHAAFPLFALGVEAGRRGGCAPAVYNAGNEIAVEAFLKEEIRFPEMADVVSSALEGVGTHDVHGVEDVLAADDAARNLAARVAGASGRTTA